MAGFKRQIIAEADASQPVECLGDLVVAAVEVVCSCNRCGHQVALDATGLMSRLGMSFPVPEIGAHLRCEGCGARDVATSPGLPALVRADAAIAPFFAESD